MLLPDALIHTAERIIQKATKISIKISTAESCTGGMVSACLTSVPGSSAIFDRGFITYANAAKIELLGVPSSMLSQYGAVSSEVATEMARGALLNSHADLTVSLTGIAGPGGGTAEKPVGLVYIGHAFRKNGKIEATSERHEFDGDRHDIRCQATLKALQTLLNEAQGKENPLID